MNYLHLYPPLTDKTTLLSDWNELVQETAAALRHRTNEEAGRKPAPEKWSAKEVLGHLCDSAMNNYSRFIRLQHTDNTFYVESYKQDAWVELGNYQNRDWQNIIQLWVSLNKAMISVIEHAPESTWQHEIILGNDTSTFAVLIQDYIGHMKHHFGQLGA